MKYDWLYSIILSSIDPRQNNGLDYIVLISDQSLKLTDQEVRALQYLLSSDFQKKLNLKSTEYGVLIDEKNPLVFNVATLDALRKALEYLS